MVPTNFPGCLWTHSSSSKPWTGGLLLWSQAADTWPFYIFEIYPHFLFLQNIFTFSLCLTFSSSFLFFPFLSFSLCQNCTCVIILGHRLEACSSNPFHCSLGDLAFWIVILTKNLLSMDPKADTNESPTALWLYSKLARFLMKEEAFSGELTKQKTMQTKKQTKPALTITPRIQWSSSLSTTDIIFRFPPLICYMYL